MPLQARGIDTVAQQQGSNCDLSFVLVWQLVHYTRNYREPYNPDFSESKNMDAGGKFLRPHAVIIACTAARPPQVGHCLEIGNLLAMHPQNRCAPGTTELGSCLTVRPADAPFPTCRS